jgi:hypothetical protein
VQPEKPVKYALCWIFQPTGSHPDIRFSAWNLTKHRYVRLSGTGCAKLDVAPHSRRRFVNISQTSACWNAQDAVSIGFQPVGHRHSSFNSNPPNRLWAEYRRQNADNLFIEIVVHHTADTHKIWKLAQKLLHANGPFKVSVSEIPSSSLIVRAFDVIGIPRLEFAGSLSVSYERVNLIQNGFRIRNVSTTKLQSSI